MGFPKASLPWLGVPVPGSKTLLPVPHCIPGVSAAIPSLLQHWPLTPSGLDFKKCRMKSHSWTLTPGLLRFFFYLGMVRWIIAKAQRSCKVGAESSGLQLLIFDTCFSSLKL